VLSLKGGPNWKNTKFYEYELVESQETIPDRSPRVPLSQSIPIPERPQQQSPFQSPKQHSSNSRKKKLFGGDKEVLADYIENTKGHDVNDMVRVEQPKESKDTILDAFEEMDRQILENYKKVHGKDYVIGQEQSSSDDSDVKTRAPNSWPKNGKIKRQARLSYAGQFQSAIGTPTLERGWVKGAIFTTGEALPDTNSLKSANQKDKEIDLDEEWYEVATSSPEKGDNNDKLNLSDDMYVIEEKDDDEEDGVEEEIFAFDGDNESNGELTEKEVKCVERAPQDLVTGTICDEMDLEGFEDITGKTPEKKRYRSASSQNASTPATPKNGNHSSNEQKAELPTTPARKGKKSPKRDIESGFDKDEMSEMNTLFEEFVSTAHCDRMSFGSMNQWKCVQVGVFARLYKMESKNNGRGSRRSPCITKTKISCLPSQVAVANFLKDSQENNVNQIRRKYLRGKNTKNKKDNRQKRSDNKINKMEVDAEEVLAQQDNVEEKNDKQRKRRDVELVVGANAKPIEEDNVGNIMLRKMGWFGGGLGPQGQGIENPVMAVMKKSRKGLGNE